MKLRWTAILLATFVAGALTLSAAQTTDSTPERVRSGRYELFQAHYKAVDAKNNRVDDEIAVFMLDSATGKVSRYSTGLDSEGEVFERWVATN